MTSEITSTKNDNCTINNKAMNKVKLKQEKNLSVYSLSLSLPVFSFFFPAPTHLFLFNNKK